MIKVTPQEIEVRESITASDLMIPSQGSLDFPLKSCNLLVVSLETAAVENSKKEHGGGPARCNQQITDPAERWMPICLEGAQETSL